MRFSGYTGWAMDIHPPKGYLDPEPGAIHHHIPGITDIPFRALYSKDIVNLLMAGRDVSCTHVALGTLRLICTGAVMGQAAGAAAGICIDKGCTPADISKNHIKELQRTLARHDQSMIGYQLLESDDHSRNAKITASSECVMEQTSTVNWHHLAGRKGLILPLESDILDSVDLFIHAKEDTTLEMDVVRSNKIQNYRLERIEKTVSVDVGAGKNWVTFPIGLANDETRKVMLLLKANPKVFIAYDNSNLTGVFGLSINGDSFDGKSRIDANQHQIPAFRISPEQRVYMARHLQDGHIRPLALPHVWCSAAMRKNTPEWLEYVFDGERDVSSIELVFNSDTNSRNIRTDIHCICPLLVRDYKISCFDGQRWKVLVNETDNYLRFRRHAFDTETTKKLKFEFFQTHGSESVEVFDIRIYG
ncbi:MAG: FAD-dependent oxidoreductase [Lentisphaeria bacterium]|nr:FAD-dependent oxidoreductase [Lentisphaeria bacterium]